MSKQNDKKKENKNVKINEDENEHFDDGKI